MPNYSLVLDTKFKPFSYQEMLAPVMVATQAHQALEQEYSALAEKSSIWENMASEQSDPYAYKMYKTYANDLEKQAEQLAREGLNTLSRRGLMGMKSRYSKEIVPIENAYKARAEEIKEQLAGRAQGMVYEGDATTSSLDRYLKNPSIKYRYANSQEGFKRVASAAAALSKELREYGRGKKLDSYTNTWLQQHGYSSSEINQAISDIEGALRGDGNIRGTNILSSILANEMQTAGISDWNKAAQMDYYNRVAPALYQAVGQTNIGTFEDYGARLAAQEAKEKRVKAYNPTTEHEYPAALRHWEGIKEKGDFDSEMYNNLLSKLTTGGKGLSTSYSGKNFVNPLRIYEEVQEYARKHPSKKDSGSKGLSYTSIYQGSVGARGPGAIDDSYEKAVEAMKKKYGVSSILTPEEYKAMQGLGFTASSKFEDMYSTKIAESINAKVNLGRPTSLNMGDYSYSSKLLKDNMLRGESIYDIDADEKISYSDIKDSDISDVAYSVGNKGKILLMIGGRRVAVPAEYHSAEAKQIIDAYEPYIEIANTYQKAELQDLVSRELRELFNSYDPSRSKTSSKR